MDAAALVKAKRWKEAEAAARAAIASDPTDADAHRLLGRALEGLGRRQLAVDAFKEALALDPTNGDTMHRIAMVYGRAGKAADAMHWFGRLVELEPTRLDAWMNLANAAKEARRVPEARHALDAALRLDPGRAQTLNARGLLEIQAGAPHAAVPFLRQAVARDPASVDARLNLGRALFRIDRLDEAEASFRFVLHLRPAHADATVRLARILQQRGRLDEALALLEAARAVHPDDRDLVRLNGIVLGKLLRPREAAELFELGVKLDPNDAGAWANLCSALWNAGKPEASVEAGRRAVELGPTLASAHHSLGLSLDALKNPAALKHLQRALSLAPADDVIRCDVAQHLRRDSRLEEAMAEYRAILARRPELTEALSGAGGTAKDAGRASEAVAFFRRAVAIKPDDQGLWDNLLLGMQYDPAITPAELLLAHRTWGERAEASRPRCVLPPRKPGPLRIGYVSGDFGHHPVGSFLLGVIPAHDRREFSITCYSTRHNGDDYTDRFKASADVWRDIAGIPEAQLAEAIVGDGIDVLVDLGGHTKGHRLPVFARKPAPVQVTWAGYVGTVGLSRMDWLIADPVHMPPGAEAEAVERIWRMPEGYVPYTPPQSTPEPAPPPMRARGYPAFGCFNNCAKLSPPVIALWRRLLESVPEARLILLTHSFADRGVQARYRELFGPVADRVEMRGRVGHRALMKMYADEVDVALDPFPYSGGATTLEALWMGVPVITLGGGDRFCARHTSGHTTHIGEPWMIARDPDDYVAIASRLVRDDEELAAARARLRPKMLASPLLDPARFTRNLEDAFRAMLSHSDR